MPVDYGIRRQYGNFQVMVHDMSEQFVSEMIEPVADTTDSAGMAIGEPGLPQHFSWRNRFYEVDEVLARWKKSSPCRNGSNERCLRKHWFSVRTTTGDVMKIYFERQSRTVRQAKVRWWLYTMRERES